MQANWPNTPFKVDTRDIKFCNEMQKLKLFSCVLYKGASADKILLSFFKFNNSQYIENCETKKGFQRYNI